MKTEIDFELLFEDGHQHINADGNPDLGFDGVDRGAQETLDVEMAFDPFEEEFDLPATLVESRDGGRRQGEVVGQKHQRSFLFDIVEADAAQFAPPSRLREPPTISHASSGLIFQSGSKARFPCFVSE